MLGLAALAVAVLAGCGADPGGGSIRTLPATGAGTTVFLAVNTYADVTGDVELTSGEVTIGCAIGPEALGVERIECGTLMDAAAEEQEVRVHLREGAHAIEMRASVTLVADAAEITLKIYAGAPSDPAERARVGTIDVVQARRAPRGLELSPPPRISEDQPPMFTLRNDLDVPVAIFAVETGLSSWIERRLPDGRYARESRSPLCVSFEGAPPGPARLAPGQSSESTDPYADELRASQAYRFVLYVWPAEPDGSREPWVVYAPFRVDPLSARAP